MSEMIDNLINDIDSMRDLAADELASVSGGECLGPMPHPLPQPKTTTTNLGE